MAPLSMSTNEHFQERPDEWRISSSQLQVLLLMPLECWCSSWHNVKITATFKSSTFRNITNLNKQQPRCLRNARADQVRIRLLALFSPTPVWKKNHNKKCVNTTVKNHLVLKLNKVRIFCTAQRYAFLNNKPEDFGRQHLIDICQYVQIFPTFVSGQRPEVVKKEWHSGRLEEKDPRHILRQLEKQTKQWWNKKKKRRTIN